MKNPPVDLLPATTRKFTWFRIVHLDKYYADCEGSKHYEVVKVSKLSDAVDYAKELAQAWPDCAWLVLTDGNSTWRYKREGETDWELQ